MRFQDLTGKRYGRLTVVAKIGKNRHKRYVWQCKCDCGTLLPVDGGSITGGLTQSCGCLQRETVRTHGMSKTRAYHAWTNMRSRCENPNCPEFKNYGARGIAVCDRWANFENFLADMGHPPAGKSVDRINNSLGYMPGNCRWATPREQSQNSRNNKMLTFAGETLCLAEWARRLTIKHQVLASRLERGWSLERALTVKPAR